MGVEADPLSEEVEFLECVADQRDLITLIAHHIVDGDKATENWLRYLVEKYSAAVSRRKLRHVRGIDVIQTLLSRYDTDCPLAAFYLAT